MAKSVDDRPWHTPPMTEQAPFFATAPRGLEDLLAGELAGLGLKSVASQRGGAVFGGGLAGAYRACLWSRVANRVLFRLGSFEADDADSLYAGVHALPWREHLDADRTLAVDFTGIRAAITHSQFGAQKVKDAIVDRLRADLGARPSVDTLNPDVRINVHMHGRQVSIAIDLSGDSLHRRGYRETGTLAPLKENLAAAMLLRADWPEIAGAGGAFIDPMCGSGTLLIEAAMIASDTAPGLLRTRFGFQRWLRHDDEVWKSLVDEALERQEKGLEQLPAIIGYDQDRSAVVLARKNIRRAGLEGRIDVDQVELGRVSPPASGGTGLVAVNPPYGERLGQSHELVPLYLRLGQVLKGQFAGWRAIILNGAGCQVGLKPERTWVMFNGPLRCSLERFEIASQADEARVLPAEDLVNRLRKNQQHLKRWLARENISCYRVYDADIPEYALAVDVYQTDDGRWLHVQEYAAPSSIDPARARSRLQAALTALPTALDVDPARMVFKIRQRQRGDSQYTRQSQQGRMLVVNEGRCRLAVNLTDYLDTGLFLDHRPLRLWLGEQAKGKRLLNLFCYTGAATVHAAVGGARSTTSVDLSNTYLDWLGHNLELNRLDKAVHERVRADCREWLTHCKQRYDLIFLDPPSFSNSTRMSGTLDIQRDHVELIQRAADCLAPDGLLIFSTNLRKFRLDPSLGEDFVVEDRSAWSVPKDFERNSRIHQCWFIRAQQ